MGPERMVASGRSSAEMMILSLLLGAALVLVAASIGAAFVARGSSTSFLLATYLLGFAEVVACSLALSPFRALTATRLLILLAVVALLALAAAARWRPPLPRLGAAAAAAWRALHDRVLAALALVVAGGFGYALALALFTPANDDDALLYHLTRAAFWHQQHAVAYVKGIFHVGVNAFPPDAEITMLFTMLLSGSDRFVGLVQLLAVGVLALAVFGIGRRLGLGLRQAMFGALVVPTLPVIALQASTPLNDIVVAALLTTTVYFLLGGSLRELALASLALALALGTKYTALIALPLLLLIALLALPRRRWLLAAALGAAASAAGLFWSFVNLYETGRLGSPDQAKWTAGVDATRGGGADALFPVARTARLLSELLDLSGGIGRDRALYVLAGGVFLLVGIAVAWRRRAGRGTVLGVVVGALAIALSFTLPSLQTEIVRAQWKFWHALQRMSIARLTAPTDATRDDPFSAWFGPLGLIVFVGAIVLAVRATRARTARRLTILFAIAPLLWIITLAIALDTYQAWTGRWVIFGMALGVAVFGLVLPYRPLAWAAVCLAALTLALVFVNYQRKPSGLTLLQTTFCPPVSPSCKVKRPPQSVWSTPRWRLQGVTRPGTADVLRIVQEHVPAKTTLALANSKEEPVYPYFGPKLERRIVFVFDDHSAPPASASWLVVSPARALRPCPGAWHLFARTPSGWRVFDRIADRCSG
jgi:hypothetical protein